MKVILKSDVKKVGKKGEVVEVADGYGRNFLIARGLAVASTPTALTILYKQKEEAAQEDAKERAEAQALAEKLQGMMLCFTINSGKEGKVFGSISTKQIIEELRRQGIHLDKRKFMDKYPISSLGVTKVRVELYKDVIGVINVQLKGSKE